MHECQDAKVLHKKRNFLRHLLEMIFISALGMLLFYGLAFQSGLSLIGLNSDIALLKFPEIVNFVMALSMTLPMVWWMFHRGHATKTCIEMGAAMFVPTLFAVGCLWLHIIPVGFTLGFQIILMLPAMILVMLGRKSEYTRPCVSNHPH
jgi:hypothetical protein